MPVRGVLVAEVDVAVLAVLFSDTAAGSSACVCWGEADLRVGGSSCSVEASDSLRSETVLNGSNGLPSMLSLTSFGRVQEAERKSRMLETVWTGLMLSLMAGKTLVYDLTLDCSGRYSLLPSQILTLMEILSAESSLLEVVEAVEPDRERMMTV